MTKYTISQIHMGIPQTQLQPLPYLRSRLCMQPRSEPRPRGSGLVGICYRTSEMADQANESRQRRSGDPSPPFLRRESGRMKNLEEARANGVIACRIRELRTAASLTQTQLARLIGTTDRSSAVLRTPIMKATPWQRCAGSQAL